MPRGVHGVTLEVRSTPAGGEALYEVPLMFANPLGVEVYPATLHVKVTITNTHPVDRSTALALRDGLLETLGLPFARPAPFTLEVGESTFFEYDVPVRDQAECLKLSPVQACTTSFSDAFQMAVSAKFLRTVGSTPGGTGASGPPGLLAALSLWACSLPSARPRLPSPLPFSSALRNVLSPSAPPRPPKPPPA